MKTSTSSKVDDQDLQKLQTKQKERFQTKIQLLARLVSHPGVISAGQNKASLKEKIRELDRDIKNLKDKL